MKTTLVEDAQDKLSEEARTHPSFKLVPVGSVLIVTRSSILQHTLPVAVTARDVAINQDLKALTPHRGMSARFLALQLRAEADNILKACVKAGTTVESIDFARLRAYPVKVAPSLEQDRIVAKLEPLLARCALVRAEVAKVERLATRQRRAALQAAFRGILNQAPRDENGSLLNWTTVPLSSLIAEGPSNGLSPRRSGDDGGTLALRLTATTSGDLRLDQNAVKRVNVELPASSKYWLRPGDLLVQRANSIEHVGAAAIFDGEDHKYIYPDLMIRIRIEDELVRRYVWRYLNSPAARRYFQERATGTAGNMPKITGRILADLPVPLAPREQISAILDAVDNLFGRLSWVEAEVGRCSRLVNKLEKAFLTMAFEGRLVKHDAAEPAAIVDSIGSAQSILSLKEKTTMKAPGLPKMSADSARDFVERQLDVWPSDGITFEQLRAEAPGTYEELKDSIFEMMEKNQLIQRYDARERKMKLVRFS